MGLTQNWTDNMKQLDVKIANSSHCTELLLRLVDWSWSEEQHEGLCETPLQQNGALSSKHVYHVHQQVRVQLSVVLQVFGHKLKWIITLRGTWMSEPNVMAIHLKVVKTFNLKLQIWELRWGKKKSQGSSKWVCFRDCGYLHKAVGQST